MTSKTRVFIACALTLMTAVGAFAQLSTLNSEWGKGPASYLFTDQETAQWKTIRTDAEAQAFIDLFWARRDPTEGTSRNEFRDEFMTRVRYSDAAFAEKRMRGAITDRGQLYIMLGPPEGGSRASMSVMGNSGGLSSASARSSDNLVWTWPREEAVALGVPRITATFNQIPGTNMYSRDTKVGQFTNVVDKVIQRNIVHPNMTTAPDWAARVGNEVLSASTSAAGKSAASRGDGKAIGRMGRVVLLTDLGTLDLDADGDPIAALQPVTEFDKDGDLAFVIEYCGLQGPLKIEAKIRDLATTSETEPAPMQAVSGCGVVPGMLSLGGLPAGSHELQITTIEPNGARLTTKQKVELK